MASEKVAVGHAINAGNTLTPLKTQRKAKWFINNCSVETHSKSGKTH